MDDERIKKINYLKNFETICAEWIKAISEDPVLKGVRANDYAKATNEELDALVSFIAAFIAKLRTLE